MQNQEDLIPATVLKTPNVTIKGVCYENGSVLVQSYSEEEGPMMCVIKTSTFAIILSTLNAAHCLFKNLIQCLIHSFVRKNWTTFV